MLQDAIVLRKQCDKVAWLSIRLFCCYKHAFEEIKHCSDEHLAQYMQMCCALYDQYNDNSELSVWMSKLFDQYRTVLKCSNQHAWAMMQKTVMQLVASGRPFLNLTPAVIDIDTEEGAAYVQRIEQKAVVH